MLVRHKVGKGHVYCLTLWAYPGHEKFQRFSATWLAHLAAQNLPKISVEDPSREVFWNVWQQDDEKYCLMLLNTDWTIAGNRKTVSIDSGDIQFETEVVERQAKILMVLPDLVLEPDTGELHLEVVEDGGIRCHGTGKHQITLHRPNGVRETVAVDLTRNTVLEVTL